MAKLSGILDVVMLAIPELRGHGLLPSNLLPEDENDVKALILWFAQRQHLKREVIARRIFIDSMQGDRGARAFRATLSRVLDADEFIEMRDLANNGEDNDRLVQLYLAADGIIMQQFSSALEGFAKNVLINNGPHNPVEKKAAISDDANSFASAISTN